jgi:hypothetical protein
MPMLYRLCYQFHIGDACFLFNGKRKNGLFLGGIKSSLTVKGNKTNHPEKNIT